MRWLVVALIGLGGALCASAQSAPVVQPLPVATLLSARQFGEFDPAVFSPDGELVAYVVRARQDTGVSSASVSGHDDYYRTGVGWSNVGSRVWVVNIKTGAQQSIAPTQGDSWMPSWSPDGRLLAFAADAPIGRHSLEARVWLWDRRSSSVRVASPVGVRGQELVWSADSRRLLVHVPPEHESGETAYGDMASHQSERAASKPTVALYEFTPESTAHKTPDGPWRMGDHPVDLGWLDVGSGQLERFAHRGAVGAVRLAPGGHRVAYTVFKQFERAGSQQVLWDLIIVDGTHASVVAPNIRLSYDGAQFMWAPDGETLVYRLSGVLADGATWIVGMDGRPPRLVTPEAHPRFEWTKAPPLWDVQGEHLFFVEKHSLWRASVRGEPLIELATFGTRQPMLLAQHGNTVWTPNGGPDGIVLTTDEHTGDAGFARVNLATGAVAPILEEHRHYGGYAATAAIGVALDGGQVAFAADDISHGSDLYLLDVKVPGGKPKRLTTINSALDRYVMGEQRIIDWRTIDGDTIRGVLILPAGYQEGRRYPLITKVYGGARPTEQLANRFGGQTPAVDNLQLFATRGYAVFLPDIPLNKPGEVMADLLKVVMPGVDKVVELGIADPARLGLTGHSFGGYNTIALLTETTRFRAAMMADGEADIVAGYGALNEDGTTYGIGVIENGQFLMNGTPWEQRSRYIENSPIYHLDRVTTPLLIVHGSTDNAVPSFESDEIFVDLRRLGKEVSYAKYLGEEHHMASWSYANQLDSWTRTLDWFDSHIGVQPVSASRR